MLRGWYSDLCFKAHHNNLYSRYFPDTPGSFDKIDCNQAPIIHLLPGRNEIRRHEI